MLTRRATLQAAAFTLVALAGPAWADSQPAFKADTFAAAQSAGKPILLAIHASWCPTCKAQSPILHDLRADPRFKDLVFLVIDFDSQEALLKRFDVRMQSTLIVFKGTEEKGRSVGDTNRESIYALAERAL